MIKTSTHGSVVSAMPRRRTAMARVVALPLLVVALLGASSSQAVATATWTSVTTPDPGSGDNSLLGVAATSASNAWAVGAYVDPSNATPVRTLILHWNGASWAQVASPNPGSSSNYELSNVLVGVAATSASNAWAVGRFWNGTARRTLVLHWNGTSWTKVASPNPGGSSNDNELLGVTAVSASNAWAVGRYNNGTTDQTLILHWNGTRWTRVASPNPGGSSSVNELGGVAATSASNAWAVGRYWNGTTDQTLILHWNGTRWTKVPSPSPGPAGYNNQDVLAGVTATSASNAWAVGSYFPGGVYRTLILHWNGTSWTKVTSPNPAGSTKNNELFGVVATSASNAWATGQLEYYDGTSDGLRTLVLHWNGTRWTKVASPNPGSGSYQTDFLGGVAATSASNAWAVGSYRPDLSSSYQTLAIRCC